MLRSFGPVRAGALLVSVLSLAGCGGAIDSAEVNEGRYFRDEPTTFKEDGELVTGTVVRKNDKGDVVAETEYKDGFPNGVHKEWYDNGQLKTEITRVYVGKGSAKTQGTARTWCENGTLQSETTSDETGVAVGKVQSWNCNGKLINMYTMPEGEFMQAAELENGEVVEIERGYRLKDGKFDGLHKRFSNDVRHLGQPLLEETWVNGVQDGVYKTWSILDGSPEEEGTYAAGKKIGIWKRWLNGYEMVIDHDVGNFVNPQYSGAFMQAAGIAPRYSYNLPLQEYRTDAEKLRYYVKEGLVDPKKKIDLGGTPASDDFQSQYWTFAYVHASPSALSVLEELGADPKAIDSYERSRLHYCVISLQRNGCTVEEVQRLIGLGLAIDQQDEQGLTPLAEVMRNSYGFGGIPEDTATAVATILMDAGANPDAVARDGSTPLTTAVLYKRFGIANQMLEKSKSPTAVTEDGFNLVHLAFLSPDRTQFSLRLDDNLKAFIQTAVAKGVDPNLKAGENGSMKDIALQAGAIDVAQFLSSLTPAP